MKATFDPAFLAITLLNVLDLCRTPAEVKRGYAARCLYGLAKADIGSMHEHEALFLRAISDHKKVSKSS
jgi:hypothetical protein